MKCKVCESTEFKYCFTTDSIGRTQYRQYCIKCGSFFGTAVKKEIALNCGYELVEQSGKALNFKADVFKDNFWKLSDEHYNHNRNGLSFGFIQHDDDRKSYILYCPECKEHLGYISDLVIEWISNSWNETYLLLLGSAINLTPFDIPKYAHKIPQILLDEYNDYIHSEKWKRQRQNRMALDNNECKLCFSKNNLRVHHITYAELGNEPMNHLLTVCKDCHNLIHGHDTQ
ncbi:MAG: hypothetical protein RL755_45 [Pseudomonadota bacterium]|jgi:hypothetical protein